MDSHKVKKIMYSLGAGLWGIASIGRHSLLITPEFGSMVWLGQF